MKELTQKQCNAIAEKLNDRLRKRYDYRTLRELQENYLVLHFRLEASLSFHAFFVVVIAI